MVIILMKIILLHIMKIALIYLNIAKIWKKILKRIIAKDLKKFIKRI